MHLFVPAETHPGETRVALVPDWVKRLASLGLEVTVEAGAGLRSGFADDAYEQAGATLTDDRDASLAAADVVVRVRKPPIAEVRAMRPGALHISHLDPFNAHETVDALMEREINGISMELIPRTTLAQKMDALSSQASLAGYVAVLVAAERLNQVLPMMMTPAGTLKPSRVFIIGVGVAGLQAIATAKRLGARVEAFDTRPAVEEQVLSLGARFVKIDLGETGQTRDGYATELTDEQKKMQQEGMAKVIAQSDILITTAQVFGRAAPRIVTRDMAASMKPGSVIVDLAAESGGNVAGSRPGEEVDVDGVRLIGAENFAGRVPTHASQVYAANIGNLITHFWDDDTKTIQLNVEDEIMDGCLLVQDGTLRNDMVKQARESR